MRKQPRNSSSSNWKGERAMKRKGRLEFAAAQTPKRRPQIVTAKPPCSHLLAKALREYGLLEIVVSQLYAKDLLALALTSKALNQVIMPRTVSLNNLLGRLKCSGKGVEIRKESHHKPLCLENPRCKEFVQCGSTNTKHKTKTKPCITCKLATCDECRIHCVYQTEFEEPCDLEDPAELPNFSGYVLLQPFEQPILSPHHLPRGGAVIGPKWQDPTTSGRGPYHDQGYLDAPLLLNETGPPEYIDEILDLDLGFQSLSSMCWKSRQTPPSPVLTSLDMAVQARKVYFCDRCFEDNAHSGTAEIRDRSELTSRVSWLPSEPINAHDNQCHCTLRSRILNRWLCLPCYQAEEETIEAFSSRRSKYDTVNCDCGKNARHVLCLWCWGEILEEGENKRKDQ